MNLNASLPRKCTPYDGINAPSEREAILFVQGDPREYVVLAGTRRLPFGLTRLVDIQKVQVVAPKMRKSSQEDCLRKSHPRLLSKKKCIHGLDIRQPQRLIFRSKLLAPNEHVFEIYVGAF